jgi:hypothetical protein
LLLGLGYLDNLLISMALPTEAHQSGNINRLLSSLGKGPPLNLRAFRGPAPNDRAGHQNENAPQRWQARTGQNTHQVVTDIFALANAARKLA